jgi:uncharacterized protein with HEPN domain
MSQHPERAVDYLQHMAVALERIQQYVSGKSEGEFLADTLVQDGVLRNITVLGEAARRLLSDAPDLVAGHPEIPFAQISATRNRITHGYETIDLEIVWNLILYDIPALLPKVAAALKENKEPE